MHTICMTISTFKKVIIIFLFVFFVFIIKLTKKETNTMAQIKHTDLKLIKNAMECEKAKDFDLITLGNRAHVFMRQLIARCDASYNQRFFFFINFFVFFFCQ